MNNQEYIKTILAKNLLDLRKSKGLTQSSLADMTKITRATYNRWENGASWPDTESLELLATFYGVKSTRFFYDETLDIKNDSVQELRDINKTEALNKAVERINNLTKELSEITESIRNSINN